jgi:eukaryotic-like serine/threonine-protein kinase
MPTYGRYKIEKEIGRGSMGVVYLAQDPQIDRKVALKVIHKEHAENTYFLSRFYKEAKAIGRLSHPNIVTVYDIGQDHGTHFIAMEFIAGIPLRRVILQMSLSLEKIIVVGIKLADALDFAHQKGIVHRDVKPSNIIMTDSGDPILTDFGIAHVDDPNADQQTKMGEMMGTPRYMSPEQVMGNAVDGRSDLYALGVILYELTTGQNLIKGRSLATIFREIIHDAPQIPKLKDRHFTDSQREALTGIILKSLQKAPQERIQTGRQFADALKRCLVQPPPDITATIPAPKSAKSYVKIGIVTLLLITIGATGWWALGNMTNNFGRFLPNILNSKKTAISDLPSQTNPTSQHVEKILATLKIQSDPVGAQVLINGEMKGLAPLSIELPLGKYEVIVRMAGHFNWEARVDLANSSPEPILAKLQPLVF